MLVQVEARRCLVFTRYGRRAQHAFPLVQMDTQKTATVFFPLELLLPQNTLELGHELAVQALMVSFLLRCPEKPQSSLK